MSTLEATHVLVTGAGGFIGTHLVKRLCAERACVGAVARDAQQLRKTSGCARMIVDLCDEEETERAIRRFEPEIIFHLAAHPDKSECFQQATCAVQRNTAMTLNLLEAARMAGTRLFVYADSAKVYGNSTVPYMASQSPQPLCSYAIGKLAGWELCRLYWKLHGLDVVSIRPTIVYGPGQGFNLISSIATRLLAGETSIQLMGGSQTRDPLYIEDAIDAFVLAAEHGHELAGEVINIGGGFEQSVQSLALQVVAACGSRATVEVSEMERRPNDTLRSYCDNREARELLGWIPKTSFSQGLQHTVATMLQAV
jgi:nucleoside-diphosphate-sugar epimerase